MPCGCAACRRGVSATASAINAEVRYSAAELTTTVRDHTALLSGTSVSHALGTAAFYSFSFPDTLPSHYRGTYSDAANATFRTLSASERAAARDAIAAYAAVSGLTFFEVQGGRGDILFSAFDLSVLDLTGTGTVFAGFATYPQSFSDSGFIGSDFSSDIYLGYASAGNTQLLLHEIGHAVGLKHPFEGGVRLASDLDSYANTIMSYNSAGAAGNALAPLDIAALQTLYGGNANDGTAAAAWNWDAAAEILTQSGTAANETLSGIGVADRISGGAGNDTLSGRGGDDVLDGGDGDDVINGGTGSDTLIGGAGDDKLLGAAGNDRIDGGSGADLAYGEDGDDVLDGRDGNDTLLGLEGADMLNGGEGADRLFGGNGRDVLEGGAGDDTLQGEADIDSLNGGTGNDVLFGGAGNDAIDGGDGDDQLLGDAGDDVILAGTGRDIIWGGTGADRIVYGAVSDSRPSQRDQLEDFESAIDRLDLAAVALWNLTVTANGGGGVDIAGTGIGGNLAIYVRTSITLADLIVRTVAAPITGDGGANVLTGGAGQDYLNGAGGNDTLRALDGDDLLVGDAGNDSLEGGNGDDRIEGGDGDDTASYADAANNYVVTRLAGGNTTVRDVRGLGTDSLVGVELLRFAGVLVSLVDLGATIGVVATAADRPEGQSGSTALAFTVTRSGNVGSAASVGWAVTGSGASPATATDFVGGALPSGTVSFAADETSKLITINVIGDTSAEADESFALALSTPSAGMVLAPATAIGIIRNDDPGIVGTAGADVIVGTPGDDQIDGLGGSDIISGLGGNDTLFGGAGDDLLQGGAGLDFAVFSQGLAQSTIVRLTAIRLAIAGVDGNDMVDDIEVLRFADGSVQLVDGLPLIDDLFYAQRYGDVLRAGVDPDVHYAVDGWREGRDPNGIFVTASYLGANRDVKAAGINPLVHYSSWGWQEGRDAAADFDTRLYLVHNADVAAARLDPLRHYLEYGRFEGRAAHAAIGAVIRPNGFDAEYYLLANRDVGAAGIDAEQHFRNYGWKEGRNPNAWFDVKGYLNTYGDVAAAGINPLDHYNLYGWREDRDPSARFDTSDYRRVYADVAAAGIDPLVHYLQYGAYEQRSTFSDNLIG